MATDLKQLQTRLWEAADSLRANSGLRSSEYSTPVLGLIFLRYADKRFADPAAWQAHACAVAGRNFTGDEWAAAFPDRAYRETCIQH